MKPFPRLRSWCKSVLHRSRIERDIDQELRFHIESYIDDLLRSGLSRKEAEQRARLEFGNIESHKEDCRDSLGLRLWNELRADLRYALRSLRQSPGFTAVAVISLALGIGANTAIFSLAEDVLLKPLAVDHPEQLRLLSWVAGPHSPIHSIWGLFSHNSSPSFSYPVFKELQHRNDAFQSLFAFKEIYRLTATIDGHAEQTAAELVSGNMYRSLSIQSIAGRSITPIDDASTNAVAVISDAFWSRRFGRSTSIVGKQFELNRTPITIIGVNPPDFKGVETGFSPDFFLPISLQPQIIPSDLNVTGSLLTSAKDWWVSVMGRLKPGITDAQAQAELSILLEQAVKSTIPKEKTKDMPRIRLNKGNRGFDELRRDFAQSIYVLLALVSLVLLIACVNLANLLLARSAARQHEMGIRLALGAGRARILRQVFTESLLLALFGGVGGLFLGYCGRNLIPALMSASWSPSNLEGLFDARVVAFTVGATFCTAILFGVAPAWRSTRADVNSSLSNSRRMTKSRDKSALGKALIAFQVSLSVLLLIGAGLFVRTLLNLESAKLGFQPAHVLLFGIDLPRTQYPAPKRVPAYQQIESKLESIPGVEFVSLSESPLIGNGISTTDDLRLPGKPDPSDLRTTISWVSPGFFQTMGIPIVYGRPFNVHDTTSSERVIVLNQRLAKILFPRVNPVGLMLQNGKDLVKVVGISGDTKYSNLRTDPPPTFYLDYAQDKDADTMTFEIKTAVKPDSLIPALRKAVASIDKDLPLIDVRTQNQQISATLVQEKAFSALTTGFGILALALASIGIYGLMAYNVARRVNEIGIRLALGAQARQILSMILREGLLLALSGIVLGVIAALGLTRLIAAMLYGITPTDPLTITAAALLLLAVAVLSAFLPARRASRIEPTVALRHE